MVDGQGPFRYSGSVTSGGHKPFVLSSKSKILKAADGYPRLSHFRIQQPRPGENGVYRFSKEPTRFDRFEVLVRGQVHIKECAAPHRPILAGPDFPQDIFVLSGFHRLAVSLPGREAPVEQVPYPALAALNPNCPPVVTFPRVQRFSPSGIGRGAAPAPKPKFHN